MFGQLEDTSSPGTQTEIFQVDERVAPPGSDDRNLTHLLAEPLVGAQALHPADAGQRRRPRGGGRRYAAAARARSTSSTSASAPTATPPRWSPATRCSRSTDRRVAVTAGEYQGPAG